MTQPQTWAEIVEQMQAAAINPLEAFSEILTAIGVQPADALEYSAIDFADLECIYTLPEIVKIAAMVYAKNAKKYAMLLQVYNVEYNPIDNVDAHEEFTDTRTPDITRTSSSEGTSNSEVKNNQERTTTDTPNDYKTTTEISKNPYDNPGFTPETKQETTDSGSRTTTESFSGAADTSSATSTGTSSSTETGTETIVHTSYRHGNIGVTSTQQLITQQIELAPKMDILSIIFADLIDAVCIQVWG